MKEHLANSLVVSVPKSDSHLLLYVAASDHGVSAVLVHEQEKESGKTQKPVYFILEALSRAKLNYTELEKIAYAVLTASRKLKHYFQAHEISVPTSLPLQDLLRNKEASGRIGKWATELSQFGISCPQNSNQITSIS